MPTCKVDITAVTNNADGTSTGTYGDGGGPGIISPDGTIDLRGQQGGVDLQFDITAEGYTFANPGFSVTAVSPFGPPTNNSTTQCSVVDTNVAAYEYTLHLLDSSGNGVTLDPRVINR